MGIKKYLSADGLHQIVSDCFRNEVIDTDSKYEISWHDCIMSGLSVFGLKFPSLLQYNDERDDDVINKNLKGLYKVLKAPSDTCLRERLDLVSPSQFRAPFRKIFSQVQRSKLLERYKTLGGYYLLSVDGTGHFSSKKINCENCCQKKHRTGEITYYHQLLCGAIVHPDEKPVIPIAPTPIVNKDGSKKNDCERNASKRFFKDFRREHPHLKTLVLGDALFANYPHLKLLDELNLAYIITAKPGSNKSLFDYIEHIKGNEVKYTRNKVKHKFCYYHDVPLNDKHEDYKVNVVEYWEIQPNGKEKHFTWIASIEITNENVFDIMRAGRTRWKIENETFNTLKNNRYNFEHNYGHGKKNLCSNFGMLMFLAFLIDQVQLLACDLYKKLKKKYIRWSTLFDRSRLMFIYVVWNNWEEFYEFVLNPNSRPPPNWFGREIPSKA